MKSSIYEYIIMTKIVLRKLFGQKHHGAFENYLPERASLLEILTEET